MHTATSAALVAAIHREGQSFTDHPAPAHLWRCQSATGSHQIICCDSSGARKQQGFTLIELMIVLAILAILLALAVPSYNTFVARAKVSECLHGAAAMKTAIAEATMSFANGGFPPSADAAGIDPGSMALMNYCEAATYTPGTGALTMPVDEAAVGVTGTIEMVLIPTLAVNSPMTWDCQPGATSGDALRYLPTDCRI